MKVSKAARKTGRQEDRTVAINCCRPLLGVGYRDLVVWQRAMSLSHEAYALTASFPKQETYGLVAQMRRSMVSVASNIAEGEGRLTLGERRQALSTARGSLFEVTTQAEIAARLGYCDSTNFLEGLDELRRILDAYVVHVRKS